MICGQVDAVVDTLEGAVVLRAAHDWRLSCGFTDRLWNCSVDRPAFRLVQVVGTLERSSWHFAMLIGPSGRESQSDDWSAKAPDERMTPPSEPSNTCVGLFGLTTSACWSGCSALAAHGRGSQQFAGSFGCMVLSAVRSLHVWPASVEYRTARPLLENPYSPYW